MDRQQAAYSAPQLAARYGVSLHALRRLLDVLEELAEVVVRVSSRGRYVPADQLPDLEARLRKRGLLPAPGAAVGASA